MSGNLDGNFSPGPYCTCNLGFLDHIHTGVKAWISEMCTWLSPHLGHPRTNFIKMASGPSRTAQVLWLLSCLQLGPPCPSMGPVFVLPHCRSQPILVSVALNDGNYFCCLFSSHLLVCEILTMPQGSQGGNRSVSLLRCDFTSLSPNGFLCWMRIRFLLNS